MEFVSDEIMSFFTAAFTEKRCEVEQVKQLVPSARKTVKMFYVKMPDVYCNHGQNDQSKRCERKKKRRKKRKKNASSKSSNET